MYDLAHSIYYCLQAGTRVDLAWLVDVRGLDYRNPGDALMVTPGGGRVGSVLAGAADGQLADLAAQKASGRLVDVSISPFEASLAGLSGTGTARCLLMPATELPAELWPLLQQRVPVCLVTTLDGTRAGPTALFTQDTIGSAPDEAGRLFAGGGAVAAVLDQSVITVLRPVPRLFVVGRSPIVDALAAAAALLGWSVRPIADVDDVRQIAGLGAIDGVVVAAHDVELAGAALAVTLAGDAGYVGGLGSRAMQQTRAQWLAERGVVGIERIHGPAGLDIGARTPAEIAVSIVAEMISVIGRGTP